jgi:hypothetical protein
VGEGGTHFNVIGVTDYHFTILVFGEQVVAAGKWRWPMHEVEVEIVGVEVFERGITSLFHIVWMMRVVP